MEAFAYNRSQEVKLSQESKERLLVHLEWTLKEEVEDGQEGNYDRGAKAFKSKNQFTYEALLYSLS